MRLPLAPTPLVGRAQDVLSAEQLLLRDGVRLLTLTGAGGSGKTRVALQVASDLIPHFRDGVYFVDLAAVNRHELVVPTIARIVGVLEESGLALLSQLVTRLSGRRVLLVLDNFEHVVGAATEIAELLATCADVRILVTSRVPLGVRAERELLIAPLSIPSFGTAGLADLEQLAAYPAVALFVQRATAVQSDFALTIENASSVVEICRRLDGLPLAIELAATRVRVLTPGELNAVLSEHSLTLLSGGARDLPERQQTLRNAIAWSYDLLEFTERVLFRRLSVFRGGCTVAAACALYGSDSQSAGVIEGLESLVAKNLLVRAPHHIDEAWFTMLGTVREFASEQLDASGERSLAEQSAAGFCRTLAEAAEPKLLGQESRKWMARLDTELENINSVVEQASASGQSPLIVDCLRMVGALWWFCRQRGYLAEAHDWTELLLPLYRRRDAVRGWALLTAFFGWQLRDASSAAARASEAVAIADEIGDRRLKALSLVVLALVSVPGQSQVYLAEALSLFRALGDEWGIGRTLLHMASDHDLPAAQARGLLSEAHTLFRRIGHTEGVGSVHRQIGNLALRDDHLQEAQHEYEQALETWKTADYHTFEPALLLALGDVAVRRGLDQQARIRFAEALRLASDIGSRRHVEEATLRLADIAQASGAVKARNARLGGLTERQLEVAALVAHGDTNKQIAEKLVISERTAEHHVENILAKLGLASRTQLGIWAAEHELTA